MRIRAICALLLFVAGPAVAQHRAGYRISDQVLDAGGHPSDGVVLASTSYRITMDAVGESAVGIGMTSAAYSMSGGFVGAYTPPREVAPACHGDVDLTTCLRFADKLTLLWPPQRADGGYNVYRGDACYASGLFEERAPVPETPGSGKLHTFLVTARNRIEEGPRGYDSTGARRPNPTPCP